MTLRILDPSGAATDWLAKNFPDAEIESIIDEENPYDAAVLTADLDNNIDAAGRISAVAQYIKRPGGRIFVSVPEGIKDNKRTSGRRRSWRSVDVADLMRRYGRLEEFGVDDNGYISAAIEPFAKKKEIAVWTGFAIGPWHPMDIVNRGLGGSETAAYRLAEVLAEMGYIVTLYGHFQQEGAVKDVILRDWKRFDPTVERQAVICFRDASMFEMPVNAATKILWLEDVAGAEGLTEERAANLDYVIGVSQWHAQNLRDVYPWLPDEKIIGMRNGIRHDFFEGEAPEREPRVLFTSSPDRGLDIVLECWPRIREQVPDAVLAHLYGPWYNLVADRAPAITVHRQRVRELSEQPGVNAIGSLGQRDLAMLMRSSLVWCHPSYFTPGGAKFDETSCISAMEAQAAGLVVVAGDWGALHETVQVGMRLDGDPKSEEWQDRFVDGIVKGLTDPRLQEIAQREGPLAVGYNDWYGVAIKLQDLWGNRAVATGAKNGVLVPG